MSKIKLWPILFTLSLVLTSCASPAAVSETGTATNESTAFTVTDSLGREVQFDGPPQRIVLPGRALFMVADALYLFPEAPERIVAMGDTAQGGQNFIPLLDPDYEEKALLEIDAGAEQVAAYQPDAVILKSFLAQSLGSSIEALGVPVVYIDFETPEHYHRDLQILGKVLQNEARAAEASSMFQERLDDVSSKTAGLDENEKPSVLLLYYSDRDGAVAFNVPPMNWIQTQMVELAGGTPVWSDASLGQGWTTVTLEQIAAWDADFIFIISYFSNPLDVVETLKQDENWALLRANQEGRLLPFAADFFSWDQPDTRWILGLQWLAKQLHPELFSDLDITAEARDFYHDFYGVDAGSFSEKILPVFKGVIP